MDEQVTGGGVKLILIDGEEFIVEDDKEQRAANAESHDHMKALLGLAETITLPATPQEIKQTQTAGKRARLVSMIEQRAEVAEKLAADPSSPMRLCKNPRCAKLVEPSKKDGVVKLFCQVRCRDNYHTRMYRQRERRGGTALELADGNVQARCHRSKPISEAIAKKRYETHRLGRVNDCPNASAASKFRCPGYSNPHLLSEGEWGKEERGANDVWPGDCLIMGTLLDDWYEAWAKDRQRIYRRRWTDEDGRWLIVRRPYAAPL